MTLGYLASPYNDDDPAVMAKRERAAVEAAGILLLAELRVFLPIAHNVVIIRVVGMPTGWAVWEKFDKTMLGCCSLLIVLLLPGERSKGIADEIEEARRLGLEIKGIDPADLPRIADGTMAWQQALKTVNGIYV